MKRDVSGWMVRWDEARAARLKGEGAWADKTIADYLADIVRDTPDKVLVTDRDRDFTARRLWDRGEKLARALVQRGYKPGDTLSFQLPNWVEAVEINLAAAMAGLVLNPIVPIYRGSEVGFMLKDSRSRLIFIPGSYRKYDYREMIAGIAPELRADFDVIVVRDDPGGFAGYEALIAEARDDTDLPGADPDAIKMIMYTSGTTGRAKGVLHSHNSLQAENRCRLTHLALTPDDIMLNPSPVTHVTGTLYSLCIPFTCGVRTVMLDTWDAQVAFDMMRDERVTGIVAATIFLRGFVDVAKERGETPPDLRFFLCGGAQVPPELIREAARIFPNCVPSRIYGSTEVPCITAGVNTRDNIDMGANTDGQIWLAEARLVDPVTGAPVAAGEEGEIVANAPQMLLGYARVEDNDDAFDEEGYFHMGDLGKLVGEDYITVTGRKKDLIIRAGENLSPKEVEDILYNHPNIADISIVAMPDKRTGEKAAAFVVPAEGKTVTLESIAAYLIDYGTAKQKIPEWLEIVDDFPRTSVGKVRKDLLRKRARDIYEAQSEQKP
ncbi:AMP-binding protein [Hoeflea sp.]|uniref:AMP-binding protein n=1 Tax=Hoeflea sp. TaxID=1940281 RepID=UPI0025C43D72|nr:AMP-binding protein [Hoeflea sp.]